MSIKGRAARAFVRGLSVVTPPGWELFLLPKRGDAPGQLYAEDGLYTDKTHEFVNDPVFARAYARGVKAAGWDYHVHWRVHAALWAAATASRVDGDFVECGTGRGMFASAILESLPWSSLDRRFLLIDTFVPFRVGDAGAQGAESGTSEHYANDLESVKANFAEWERVELVQGRVPEVLADVDVDHVAFLHIDLNSPEPERAALEHFWPKLSAGAVVLLDDYGFPGEHYQQKVAVDAFAKQAGTQVLGVPTGQGLIVK